MIDAISAWLGSMPYDVALWVITLAFIGLDVIAGTVKAIVLKKVSSEKARKGVLHKSGFILAMLLTTCIDVAQHVIDLGFSVPVFAVCAGMIILCEVYSISEHIQECNPEINLSWLKKDDKDNSNGNS